MFYKEFLELQNWWLPLSFHPAVCVAFGAENHVSDDTFNLHKSN